MNNHLFFGLLLLVTTTTSHVFSLSYPSILEYPITDINTLPTDTSWISYLKFYQFNRPNATLSSISLSITGQGMAQTNVTSLLPETEVKGYVYNTISMIFTAGTCCSSGLRTTINIVINSVDFDLSNYQSQWDLRPIVKSGSSSRTFNTLSGTDIAYFSGDGIVSMIVAGSSVLSQVVAPGTESKSIDIQNVITPVAELTSATLRYYYHQNLN